MQNDKPEFLKQHKPTLIGLSGAKKAAVCIPLIGTEDGYEILFEVRSAGIGSQPGDLCFPGGSLEDGETTKEAAIRETMEELRIDRDRIEVLGLMDVFGGVSGTLYVYPYAALLSGYEGTFNPDEVERVFTVPLAFFLEHTPEVYHTRLTVEPEEGFPYARVQGGREYAWRERREEVLFYQYKEETIWGMTAKILAAFVEIWKNG